MRNLGLTKNLNKENPKTHQKQSVFIYRLMFFSKSIIFLLYKKSLKNERYIPESKVVYYFKPEFYIRNLLQKRALTLKKYTFFVFN
ncbi:hypothetical protein BWK59_11705 [Flavobacterium davisii]|uniref:Uncharacterized protein n=1 Tax=Flavobacterium davisii TaxID=2906077 RepID=A0A246GGC5_9FLAO|nr:hypothetical protein BWK59_11705 [Flavobacterium davisii]